MFEESVLDNSRQTRSKWSWMGLAVQAGMVTAMLLVPMVSPEILSVMLPHAMIYVPVKPIAPMEVEVQRHSSSAPATETRFAAARPAYKPFTAPRGYDRPVANIIDDYNYAPPAYTLGPPTVAAGSLAFAPVGNTLPSAPPPKPKEAPKPVRVGGLVQAANILTRVSPPYPPLARQARVSGVVRLEGIIARDGTVQHLQVISGHPLLVPTALDAVKKWRYRPTRLNGEPVEVSAPIEVHFILAN